MTPDYAYMSIYTKDSELVKQVNEEVKRRGWSRNQFFCFLIEKAIAGQLVCITDKSLLEFAVMRAQELSLQNLDYYVSMLIKLDELGQVDHEGEINRDLLLEKLDMILKALGVTVEKPKLKKMIEISENAPEEEVIKKMLEEEIL